MNTAPRRGGQVIIISLLIAYVLTIMPLPEWARDWRPDWVALVLIYWCMAAPQRVGVGVAWLAGLLLDVLHGALLGQYALGLAVTAYLVLNVHLRLRNQPLWQQAGVVMAILAIHRLLVLWVNGVIGHPPGTWGYWLPVLVGGLLWPWLFVVLRDLRRRYKVA